MANPLALLDISTCQSILPRPIAPAHPTETTTKLSHVLFDPVDDHIVSLETDRRVDEL